MPEQWKPQPIEVYKAWVKQIRDEQPMLTEWEKQFVTNIEQRLMHGICNLSEREAEKLEEIYVTKTR